MCDNFPNIRVTEGNEFMLLLPLKSRSYISAKPIDEDIDPSKLDDIVVTFGGVEYAAEATDNGVQITLPATLSVGTYDILLTAEYFGNKIRAAYESAVTIVPWSAQSSAEQYVAGSPYVLRSAYVLGVRTDAELEYLKAEYREKIAQAEAAKTEAAAAKAEWENKAASLDGLAKEETLSQGVQDIRGDIAEVGTALAQGVQDIREDIAGIDTSALAKQGDNPEATLSAVQAKLENMLATGLVDYNGYVFSGVPERENLGVLLRYKANLIKVNDPYWTNQSDEFFVEFLSNYNSIEELELVNYRPLYLKAAVTYLTSNPTIRRVALPRLQSTGYAFGSFSNCANLISIDIRYAKFSQSSNLDFATRCPSLIEVNMLNSYSSGGGGLSSDDNLIKLITGATEHDHLYKYWNPINALNPDVDSLVNEGEPFANNLEKLLYNIRTYIAANLHDRNGQDPFTFTFHPDVKAVILADQETADAFTDKNWIIA